MHDSLIDNVKIHVDEVSPRSGGFRPNGSEELGVLVEGWCASDSIDIKDVRVSVDGENPSLFTGEYRVERKDVYEFYENNESFLSSGFSISVPRKIENSGDIFLQILHDEEWKNVQKLDPEVSGKLREPKTNFEINETFDTNVIVVDNFYKDPYEVREFALSRGSYKPHIEYHKGQRTEENFKPEGVKQAIQNLLQKKVTKWDEHGANGVFQFCTSEDAIVYHVDSQSYAAVVYLTPDAPPECGTTFYKSKANGLRESPKDETAERLGKSKDHLTFEIFSSGFYDKTKFETVDVIGNVFNRLVIWDAQLIHAASEYFGSDLRDSRLFHMFFFDVEE